MGPDSNETNQPGPVDDRPRTYQKEFAMKPKKDTKSVHLSIRLTPFDYSIVLAVAKANKQSVSSAVASLINRAELTDQEDDFLATNPATPF